jgi:hypothetical protein
VRLLLEVSVGRVIAQLAEVCLRLLTMSKAWCHQVLCSIERRIFHRVFEKFVELELAEGSLGFLSGSLLSWRALLWSEV